MRRSPLLVVALVALLSAAREARPQACPAVAVNISTCGTVSGAGISSLNGLTDSTQTFATGTGFTWSSASGVHTFALHANLQAFAGVTGAADRLPYFTGVGTLSLATFTSFGRTMLAWADAAAARTGLSLVPGTDIQAYSANLAALSSAGYTGTGAFARADQPTFTTGILSPALSGSSSASGQLYLIGTSSTGGQLNLTPSLGEGGSFVLKNAAQAGGGAGAAIQTVGVLTSAVDATTKYYNPIFRFCAQNASASPTSKCMWELGVEGNYTNAATDAVQRFYLWDPISSHTVFFIDKANPDYFIFSSTTKPQFLNTVEFGSAGSYAGKTKYHGSTSGTVTVQSAAAAGTWSLTLPTSAGTSGYTLQTDGTGVTSWVAPGGGSSPPFDDGTAIAKGSGDATKRLRLEVDGITTGTTRVVTAPNSDTTLPIVSQVVTIAGPTAARTYTFPDANATIARTDTTNTFTGQQNFASGRFTTTHREFTGSAPSADGATCGTGSTVTGNDNAGYITHQGTPTTTCVLTFANTWTNAAICNVSTQASNNRVGISAFSTTAITISFPTAPSAAGVTFYQCSGYY